MLTDGVAVRPILPRHGLVDYREACAAHGFRMIPDSALCQGNAEDGEVFGTDEVEARLRLFPVVPHDFDSGIVAIRWWRGVGRNAGGDDFRHRSDLRAELLEVFGAVLPGNVGVVVYGNRDRHRASRVVAEIGLHEPEETLARGARHGEQEKRERNLSPDHGAVGTAGIGVSGHAPHTALHQPGDVRPRELQRRPEAEHYRGGDSQSDTEEQHRHVHLNNRFRGKGTLRQECGDQGKALPCQENAEHGSGASDGERLGEQLPDDAEAIRSHGGAHGHLMLPLGASGQEQDGHVGTSDQQ